MPSPRLLPALGAVLGALMALAAPLGAQSLSAGPEIRVRDNPRAQIQTSSIAAGTDGGFLVAWEEAEERPWARAFGAGDQPRSAAAPLAVTFPRQTSGPRVARLAGGRTVAVWDAFGQTYFPALGDRISGQILDASGVPVVSNLILAGKEPEPGARNPLVAGEASGGGFVLAWEGPGVIMARRFNGEGVPVTNPVEVSREGAPPSSVATLPGGGFVVAWSRWGFPQPDSLLVRLFQPDGTPAGAEISLTGVEDLTHLDTRVAADALGRFVVAWSERDALSGAPWRIQAQRFDTAGHPIGDRLTVATAEPSHRAYVADVAMRPEGRFLVLWGDGHVIPGDQPSTPESIRDLDTLARAFEADGAPLGPAVALPENPLDDFEYPGEADATADGWIVSWNRAGSTQAGVSALRFSLCGGGPALCLNGGRFRAEAAWRVAGGPSGSGTPIPRTDNTGAFWFFDPANFELIVKVLDGRGTNGKFWVFYGSLTDVEFDLTVTDTLTGRQRTYHNPAGTMASQADTEAFPQ